MSKKELTADDVIIWLLRVALGVAFGFLWSYGYEAVVIGWLCYKTCRRGR